MYKCKKNYSLHTN